jgi:hypothetical protein
MSATVAWLVMRGSRHIDTVYFTPDCDAEYVRRSLIHHDGYPSDITVRRRSA